MKSIWVTLKNGKKVLVALAHITHMEVHNVELVLFVTGGAKIDGINPSEAKTIEESLEIHEFEVRIPDFVEVKSEK